MIQRMDLVADTNTIKKNEDRRKKLMALLGGDNSTINPDLTQLAVDVPEKPEFDGAQAQQYKNMAKMAAIAQGIDAVVNAAGIARTEGKSNEWAPASSSVGDLGIASYNNLLGMDQAHRDQLNNWRDNVLDANKYNSDLSVKAAENQMTLDKAAIEKELTHITEMERQGALNEREATRQRGLWRRAALQQGYRIGEDGQLVKTDEEEEFKFTPQERTLFRRYQRYNQMASPADMGMDGKPTVGSPSWHRNNIIEQLGPKLYMLEENDENQPPPGRSRLGGYQDQPTNAVQRLEFQPFANDADILRTTTKLQTIAPRIRQGQATEQELEQWKADYRRVARNAGVTDEKQIENMLATDLQLIQSEGQPQSPSNQRPTENPVAESDNNALPSVQQTAGFIDLPQAQGQNEATEAGTIEQTEQPPAQPQTGRSAVPAHLRVTFDAGDKLMQQIHLMERIKQANPNVDTSIGQKRLDDLLKRYKEQLNRLSESDRQKIIQAVGHNPFESQED